MPTTFATKNSHGQSNGTTPVDVVTSPGSSHTFDIRNVVVHNRDTVAATVMLQLVDSVGPATRRLMRQTLDPDATVEFDSIVTLDGTTKKLQLVLAGATTTTPLDWVANYGDTAVT